MSHGVMVAYALGMSVYLLRLIVRAKREDHAQIVVLQECLWMQ